MDNLTALAALNWWEIFLGIILIIVCTVYLVDLGKKFLHIFGIKFQKDLDKEKEHELLITTSENLAKLQERHNKDEKEFRQCLYDFIDEQKMENQVLRNEMVQYSQNRIHDREQSREIQKELNDYIRELMGKLDEMQKNTDERFVATEEKNNKRVQSEIKERIAQSYRRYSSCKKITHMELEALEDLITTYEEHGGENSFVHSVVQKEMYTWEVDE